MPSPAHLTKTRFMCYVYGVNAYFITTDTGADFPPSHTENDFSMLPLSYIIDGVDYDGRTRAYLPLGQFYDMLESGKTASTSMVPTAEVYDFFADIIERTGKDILHISFPAAMSGCFEACKEAAEKISADYPERRVVVIDGKCASVGLGMLCMYALRKRREGASLDETAAYISDLRDHIGHAFTVDNLMHLYRGGRLGRGSAVVGQVMNLKSVIMVDERGALVNISSVMGRKKALRALVSKMKHDWAGGDDDYIVIGHGDCPADAETLKGMVEEAFGPRDITVTDIGPIIGSHCGKGMLALIYIAKNKTDRTF